MSAKIAAQHLEKSAYIYVRQSTLNQVRHHQESTERQYALRNQALALGWTPDAIRVLDRDLGKSGAQTAGREDFKTLVADVSMGQVGAIFALEASRLARSNLDWHRLIELCALMGTLVVDEDGCYDPSNFNDGLLLDLKGTMAQAELHFLRARLQGGKLNKAKKGELGCPLPVGLCREADGGIGLDPDEEVRGAVALVFRLFRETGSAYGVVQHFRALGLRFPKRAYGGVWDSQLIWGRLSHTRVLTILKNPAYAGAYVFGRRQTQRRVDADGTIKASVRELPQSSWRVTLLEHHDGYISWDDYLQNQDLLAKNRTNGETMMLSGPSREGAALLQGLLLCGSCGRKLTVRYQGTRGWSPAYECNRLRREGLATHTCMSVGCARLDQAMTAEVLRMLQPAQLELAVAAMKHLEERDASVMQQWHRRLERASYEAQLAERSYREVDPSNRLVAATLEKRWEETLQRQTEVKTSYDAFVNREALATTPEQRAQVLALAQDFPRLWHAPSTQAKDKKRMLRLLIEDITVEKERGSKQVVLHVRWQGGASSDVMVTLPPKIADQQRYPAAVVERIRTLATTLTDDGIVAALNDEGLVSPTGKPFTRSMIDWVRYRYRIPPTVQKRPGELSVKEVMKRFGVSHHVVYYWIDRGVVTARRLAPGQPYWIAMDATKERELDEWVRRSSRIRTSPNP